MPETYDGPLPGEVWMPLEQPKWSDTWSPKQRSGHVLDIRTDPFIVRSVTPQCIWILTVHLHEQAAEISRHGYRWSEKFVRLWPPLPDGASGAREREL